MPTILIEGFKFRFYSSDLHEPPHMHIIKGENEAKIWLQPVEVQYNQGYNRAELNRIVRLMNEHQNRLLETWHAYFAR